MHFIFSEYIQYIVYCKYIYINHYFLLFVLFHLKGGITKSIFESKKQVLNKKKLVKT